MDKSIFIDKVVRLRIISLEKNYKLKKANKNKKAYKNAYLAKMIRIVHSQSFKLRSSEPIHDRFVRYGKKFKYK